MQDFALLGGESTRVDYNMSIIAGTLKFWGIRLYYDKNGIIKFTIEVSSM
jgi:hypothetical protein